MTDEEIKMLAKLDRDMDSGLQPFVISGGARLAFPAELLARFGIESGQTISREILIALMQAQLELWEKEAVTSQWPEEV